MEPKLIVAVVAGGLFILLFLIFLIVSAHRRKVHEKLQERIKEGYSDENLVKMEYDFVEYDEATDGQKSDKTGDSVT